MSNTIYDDWVLDFGNIELMDYLDGYQSISGLGAHSYGTKYSQCILLDMDLNPLPSYPLPPKRHHKFIQDRRVMKKILDDKGFLEFHDIKIRNNIRYFSEIGFKIDIYYKYKDYWDFSDGYSNLNYAAMELSQIVSFYRIYKKMNIIHQYLVKNDYDIYWIKNRKLAVIPVNNRGMGVEIYLDKYTDLSIHISTACCLIYKDTFKDKIIADMELNIDMNNSIFESKLDETINSIFQKYS